MKDYGFFVCVAEQHCGFWFSLQLSSHPDVQFEIAAFLLVLVVLLLLLMLVLVVLLLLLLLSSLKDSLRQGLMRVT